MRFCSYEVFVTQRLGAQALSSEWEIVGALEKYILDSWRRENNTEPSEQFSSVVKYRIRGHVVLMGAAVMGFKEEAGFAWKGGPARGSLASCDPGLRLCFRSALNEACPLPAPLEDLPFTTLKVSLAFLPRVCSQSSHSWYTVTTCRELKDFDPSCLPSWIWSGELLESTSLLFSCQLLKAYFSGLAW